MLYFKQSTAACKIVYIRLKVLNILVFTKHSNNRIEHNSGAV